MKTLFSVFSVFCMLLSCGKLCGQDIHFTQYNQTPLLLNPANTGVIPGELRAGAIYRNQWRSVGQPFVTFSFYGDKKFNFGTDNFGAGLAFATDKSGSGGLKVNEIYLSGSYHKNIGYHKVVVGLQPGIVHKGANDFTFPRQYDRSIGGYNSALPNGETTYQGKSTFFDLNVGALYKYRFKKGDVDVGFAFFHLTKPKETLINNGDGKLPQRMVTNVKSEISFTEKISLTPTFLFMLQNQATEMSLGALVGYKILQSEKLDVAFRLGPYYRNNTRGEGYDGFLQASDAVSAVAGLTINEFDIGIAYDFNISDLKVASNSRGAFEIALTYINAFEAQSDIKAVPCRRY